MTRHKMVAAVMVALAVLALGAAACDNSEQADPTPVLTPKITPASGATKPASTLARGATAAATQPAETATSGGSTIKIEASNIQFDTDQLTAPAGTITVEFDNKDSGTPHNIHVHKGPSAKGDSVGTTKIENGPVKQTLTMTLEKGDYFYLCDVHPNMKGILTVN